MSKTVAIIGGGVAGLTAGYLLNEQHDVTLFEKDNRLGGNVYTVDTKTVIRHIMKKLDLFISPFIIRHCL